MRDKYYEFYDLAPVAFISLDKEGIIRGLNLKAAELLKAERSFLLAKPILSFISSEDQKVFYTHKSKVFNRKTQTEDYIELWDMKKNPYKVKLVIAPIYDKERKEDLCLCTFIPLDDESKSQSI